MAFTAGSRTRNPAASVFASLAVPDFRYLWVGTLAGHVAFWMQMVAQGWLAYELTESATFLGVVSAAAALPGVLLMLPSGVMADRLPRGRLVMLSNAGLTAVSPALVLLIRLGAIQPWQLVLL